MGHAEAQAALDRARRQWERVSNAAGPPEDHEEAVTWAFYAYENSVVAAAEALGLTWRRVHDDKAAVARRLHADGYVRSDIGGELERLNELRKDVQYGLPGIDLLDVDLEDLVSELEAFIDEVAGLLASAGDQ